MHFEILVEDESGKIALELILGKILGPTGHSYRIFSYKGIGHLPKNLHRDKNPRKTVLLNNLPSILKGYGKSLKNMPAAVIVVVDSDKKNCKKFKTELLGILNHCNPAPQTLFRIAIEEGESWFLGDRIAVLKAYPRAKKAALDSYVQDSICGTWQRLADAIFPGGATSLEKKGYPLIGQIKCEWAKKISPFMDVEHNASKSFQVFRDGLRNLTNRSI